MYIIVTLHTTCLTGDLDLFRRRFIVIPLILLGSWLRLRFRLRLRFLRVHIHSVSAVLLLRFGLRLSLWLNNSLLLSIIVDIHRVVVLLRLWFRLGLGLRCSLLSRLVLVTIVGVALFRAFRLLRGFLGLGGRGFCFAFGFVFGRVGAGAGFGACVRV